MNELSGPVVVSVPVRIVSLISVTLSNDEGVRDVRVRFVVCQTTATCSDTVWMREQ